MLLEFEHAQDLAGSEFAVRRFEKYRAHHKHESNPCALYAAWVKS